MEIEMISLYTETLQELLKNKHYGEASQDAFLTEVLTLMEKFPNFEFGDNLDISMLELFLHKYDIREIGAETEELFLHYWREKTSELLIKYLPKIEMWLEHFNSLFEFKVELELEDEENNSTGSQNTYYLNPVNATTGVQKTIVQNPTTGETTTTFTGGNLKVQDLDTSDTARAKNRKVKREVLQSVWGKTRPIILEQIMNLKNIYTDCLKEFEVIFMGVM